jgi:hypothetical protein
VGSVRWPDRCAAVKQRQLDALALAEVAVLVGDLKAVPAHNDRVMERSHPVSAAGTPADLEGEELLVGGVLDLQVDVTRLKRAPLKVPNTQISFMQSR